MTGTPQIITAIYDLLLYLIPQISKFPRSQRYLLGDRLETIVLDVLELLLEATYSRDKAPLLARANVTLEKARYYGGAPALPRWTSRAGLASPRSIHRFLADAE